MATSKNSSVYRHLKKEWTRKHKVLKKNLWDNHRHHLDSVNLSSKQAIAGSMAGIILLTSPATTAIATELTKNQIAAEQPQMEVDPRAVLINTFRNILPDVVQPLTEEQEQKISQVFADRFHIQASASLEGKRLNRSYGLIGAEQHLMRYPGDTMATHFDNPEDSVKYYSSGMAPGRGAWGYFAQSGSGITQEEVLREKYYIAVPTFLSPGWKENTREYSKFFKYRKMLVVNPDNGKAIVVVIGDAGPAEWTGKHLGGSPEVMKHLERVDGRARGPVLYFFIDESNGTVPLGPVDVQS